MRVSVDVYSAFGNYSVSLEGVELWSDDRSERVTELLDTAVAQIKRAYTNPEEAEDE